MTLTLEHLGHFDLPRPQGADERFGFGLAALALTPRGTMWASGKITRGLVAEITVPEPGGVAELMRGFFDPAGIRREQLKVSRIDRLGGLLERGYWLYSLHRTYYGVGGLEPLDVPTLCGVRISGTPIGPLHIGPQEHPFHQKATSHYLFEAPDARVYCGRGDGAGNANAPHGPALFRVDLQNPADAEVLLYRDAEHAPDWWSPVDKWVGGAWLKVGDTERVAFVGSKDLTGHWWYGTGEMPDEQPAWFQADTGEDWRELWERLGNRDPWYTSRGYHCLKRAVVLQLYDPAELGPGRYPEPEVITLEGFHEASRVAGCAYDAAKQLLYVGEVWPPETTGSIYPGEAPRIHTYAVSATASAPVEPPAKRDTVLVTVWDRAGERYEGEIPRASE